MCLDEVPVGMEATGVEAAVAGNDVGGWGWGVSVESVEWREMWSAWSLWSGERCGQRGVCGVERDVVSVESVQWREVCIGRHV